MRLSYDTLSCHVWLDPLPDRSGMVQEICDYHAKRLTIPRGWTMSDRRVAKPALFDYERLPRRRSTAHEDGANGNGGSPDTAEGALGDVVENASGIDSGRSERLIDRRDAETKPGPRLLRGRHPSLSASELFGTAALFIDSGRASSQDGALMPVGSMVPPWFGVVEDRVASIEYVRRTVESSAHRS